MSPNVLEAVQETQAEWQLEDYLRFFRYHWRWLAACGVVGVIIAWTYAARLPNVYEARARLLIDRSTVEPVRFAEPMANVALRDTEFLATEYQLIVSRPVAEQVIQDLNLTGFPPFSTSRDPPSTLAGMVKVLPVRGTKLVDLLVASSNPSLAMRIATSTAQAYTQLNLQRRRQQTTGGVGWLRDEVARTEIQMKAAQEALQRFKETHQMVSLEERQNVIVQRLKEVSTSATGAKTARVTAEATQSEIQRALTAGTLIEALPAVQSVGLVPALRAQLTAKEAELEDRRRVYGEKHPTILALETEITTLRQQLQQEARKAVETSRLDYETAKTKEEELQQALAEQEQLALELNRLELEYNNLTRAAQVTTDLYGSLVKRLKEMEVAESLETNNVRVIEEARLPEHPVAPDRHRIHLLGLVLGIAVGGTLAFLREALSRTVQSRQQLEATIPVPFLGHVLHLKMPHRRHAEQPLFFLAEPEGMAAEGMRGVRTTLEFLLPTATSHRILLTSSFPEEGKSLVSANLAVALQELGRRVVLIDADMRRPRLFRTFQLLQEPGLSTYLQGQATLEEICQVPSNTHGLTVICSGAVPTRPVDLLASDRMITLLDALSATFQYLIIDSPPVLAVADATILTRLVDSAVLVVRARRTPRDATVAAHTQLVQSPLKFIGVLLNDFVVERSHGHYYYYYGEHGRERKSEKHPSRQAPSSLPPLSDAPAEAPPLPSDAPVGVFPPPAE